MRLAELQDRPIQRTTVPQEERARLQAMMPTRFSSLDDLPTAKELADLSDEELFQEA